MARTVVRRRVRRTSMRIKWTITCSCGRRFTVRKGQTRRCICGRVYRC